MSRNLDLDGVRGVAILLVIYHHIFAVFGWLGAGNAFIGVDLFFSLSGYLITTILIKTRGRTDYFRRFYKHRTLRIFPAYYLILLINFIVSLALGAPGKPSQWLILVLFGSSLSWNYLSANFALLPGTVPMSLTTLWSLSVEEIFYLIWAPIVLHLNRKPLTVLLLTVFSIEPVIRLVLPGQKVFGYFTFYGHLDSIAAGSLVAILFQAPHLDLRFIRRLSGVALWVTLALEIIVFHFIGYDWASRAFAAFGYSMVAVAWAVLLAWLLARPHSRTPLQWFLRLPWLRYFGRRSYMLYLLHPLVFPFITSFAIHARHVRRMSYITIAVAFVILVILSELSWRYFEAPILSLKEQDLFSLLHIRSGSTAQDANSD